MTTGAVIGETDPDAWEPNIGVGCGIVWKYGVPTPQTCGGPPILSDCYSE